MILGVFNHEYEEVKYNIIVRLENTIVATMNDVILEHEGVWEKNYTFSPERVGKRINLKFILYKNGFNEKYRTLNLWITVYESA